MHFPTKRLVALSLLFSAFALGNAPIKIGVSDGHGGVFNFKGNKLSGTASPKFQCLLDGLSQPYKLVSLPHARMKAFLESGDVDAAMPLGRSPERDRTAYFASKVLDVEYLIIGTKPYSEADASTHAIVTVRAERSVENLIQTNYSLIEVSNWTDAIEMLKRKRADFLVAPDVVYEHHEEALKHYNSEVLFSGIASVYVSKASKRADSLLLEFNQIIDTCNASTEPL